MERRAYHPYKSTSPGKLTRMEKDLSSSPHNPMTQMNGLHLNRTGRSIAKGYVPHICVIGAGVSGLRCAAVLASKGLKVTILEARDRVGGRVHQSGFLGPLVDLGPNWIHGTGQNPILDLAHRTNSVVVPPEFETSLVYDENGHQLNQKRASEISELVWGFIGEAFKYSNENSAVIPPNMSLMDFVKMRAEEEKLDENTSKLVLQMAQVWGDYVGEPIERQSLKYCWLEECLDEKNLFVASTYKGILAYIAEAALPQVDVHLSTKVTSVQSSVSNGNPTINIITAEKSSFLFDEVVVTTPLGWLKRNQPAFVPTLPPRLLTAISNMSYGRLEKVYLTFSTPFWTYHTASSSQLDYKPPFFTQFLCPAYAPVQNPNRWTLEPVSLASLPHPTAHPTLLFYLNGPGANHVTSLISTLQPESSEYYSVLNDFFRPYYSRLPNYDPASLKCQPVKILSTNWQNDEFAGWGSYTNFQLSDPRPVKTDNRSSTAEPIEGGEDDDGMEEVRLDKDIEALRRGCPDRGIWFAGEHTAPFVALGTVTGAYWSGEAVARRVADAYGIEDEGGIQNKETRRVSENGTV